MQATGKPASIIRGNYIEGDNKERVVPDMIRGTLPGQSVNQHDTPLLTRWLIIVGEVSPNYWRLFEGGHHRMFIISTEQI